MVVVGVKPYEIVHLRNWLFIFGQVYVINDFKKKKINVTKMDEIQSLRFTGILCSQTNSLIIPPQCLLTATSNYYSNTMHLPLGKFLERETMTPYYRGNCSAEPMGQSAEDNCGRCIFHCRETWV